MVFAMQISVGINAHEEKDHQGHIDGLDPQNRLFFGGFKIYASAKGYEKNAEGGGDDQGFRYGQGGYGGCGCGLSLVGGLARKRSDD